MNQISDIEEVQKRFIECTGVNYTSILDIEGEPLTLQVVWDTNPYNYDLESLKEGLETVDLGDDYKQKTYDSMPVEYYQIA